MTRTSLLDSWMPAYDVAARYEMAIEAPVARVYATLLATDLGRPWLVRGLMGIRMLPKVMAAPRTTWERMRRGSGRGRSLSDVANSDFILLEEAPPREIVLGITGRFWKMNADIVRVPPERFRDPLPAGLAQAAWNFEVSERGGASQLATETRIRCADAATLRSFRRYWRVVAPGSGLIRYAIMTQVRREATGAGEGLGR